MQPLELEYAVTIQRITFSQNVTPDFLHFATADLGPMLRLGPLNEAWK